MIKDGKFDSKVIGVALATLGLVPLMIIAFLLGSNVYRGYGISAEELRHFLPVAVPALIMLIVGIRMTARVSDRFLGLICIILGVPFIWSSLIFLHDPASSLDKYEFDPYMSIYFGIGLIGIGLSKLTGIGNKGEMVPVTEVATVRAGVFDFMKLFGSVLFIGLVFPALVVSLLIGLVYIFQLLS